MIIFLIKPVLEFGFEKKDIYLMKLTLKPSLMKKVILIALIFISSTSLFAQKGSIYAGGALGFQEDYFRIAPEAGYWLGETLQLGAVISYENDSGGAETTTFKPHVYFRKFYPLGEKFSIYAGANVRFVSVDVDGAGSDSSTDAFVDFGFSYSLADRWGVVGRVASIGLINDDFVVDFDMSSQPLFNVGIYYTIKK